MLIAIDILQLSVDMWYSCTFLAAFAAVTLVFGSPAAVNKREPVKKLYTSGFPAPNSPSALGKRVTECQAGNAVIRALQAVSKVAYPFYSTYISIQDVTSTATSVSFSFHTRKTKQLIKLRRPLLSHLRRYVLPYGDPGSDYCVRASKSCAEEEISDS